MYSLVFTQTTVDFGLNYLISNVMLLGFDFLLLFITKTWLNDEIFNEKLDSSNHNDFRCDKISARSVYLRGSGVLIGIRVGVAVHLISNINVNNKYWTFNCKFNFNGQNFLNFLSTSYF